MNWDLPYSVTIDGQDFAIENNCDYRVVLDCLSVYEDTDIDVTTQHKTALFIFYKEPWKITNTEEAVRQMIRVIDCESEDIIPMQPTPNTQPPERLMSWGTDFKFIAPAVSRILGYDVRTPEKFTHWWSLMGAYMEIGECAWQTILSIRRKKMHGEKLESWEQKLYAENKKDIDLPQNLTDEEKEWLNSDW